MKNKLVERLNRVLMQDKSLEPQRVLPSLKADMRDLLREYAEFNTGVIFIKKIWKNLIMNSNYKVLWKRYLMLRKKS